jgi:hypothetical protein
MRDIAGSRDEEERNLMIVSSFLRADISNSFVLDASRDCVAILKKIGTEFVVAFAFRGTSIASDYVVDAKLAANARSILRLDEAREFVRNTLSFYKGMLEQQTRKTLRYEFYGHSLGGFIGTFFSFSSGLFLDLIGSLFLAEGVGYDYPGSHTYTFQTAAPLLNRGCRFACAFNPSKKGYNLPTRYIREGDLIPSGYANLGPGNVVARKMIGQRSKSALPSINFLEKVKHRFQQHKVSLFLLDLLLPSDLSPVVVSLYVLVLEWN